MPGKDRDYDDILKFCEEFKQYTEDCLENVSRIENCNIAAESALRDDIGKRNTQKVEEFCEKMREVLNEGEELVRVLERKYKEEADCAEELRRRSR